jgi:hypothetical protein
VVYQRRVTHSQIEPRERDAPAFFDVEEAVGALGWARQRGPSVGSEPGQRDTGVVNDVEDTRWGRKLTVGKEDHAGVE